MQITSVAAHAINIMNYHHYHLKAVNGNIAYDIKERDKQGQLMASINATSSQH